MCSSDLGARGESAHTAETIGMAQRGGSVVSHVRIGEGAYSPLIAKGCADAIIAFEPAEAVRAFPYLKKGGTIGFVAPSFGCTTEPYKSAFANAQKKWKEDFYNLNLYLRPLKVL